MAASGSWPSIATHGLLSTAALLDRFNVAPALRATLLNEHRPESVVLANAGPYRVVVRDQKPMDDKGLRRALPARMSPAEWYGLLNQHVFFWVTEDRLRRLLEARAYRNSRHTVLVLRTADVLAAHLPDVYLSPINSGATKPMPHPRDESTFLPLSEYPYAYWLAQRGHRGETVVEFAVRGGVLDVLPTLQCVAEIGAFGPRDIVVGTWPGMD